MSCRVMGIVNVTPDSFSDGGKFFRPEEAIRRARNLIDEGADIIDLGGESTRPGAIPLGWEEEWSRLEPVLRGLSPSRMGTVPPEMGTVPSRLGSVPLEMGTVPLEMGTVPSRMGSVPPEMGSVPSQTGTVPLEMGTVPISVDTYHPETAERALADGASIINCVKSEPIPEMLKLCAKFGAELVLPASAMGSVPIEAVSTMGSVPSQMGSVPIYLDPMIGFGTTREEDLERLKSIPLLATRGRVLVGASRKRIVKKLTGEKVPGKDLAGNLTIAVWAAMNGASVVRVHDVRETVQALKVLAALR